MSPVAQAHSAGWEEKVKDAAFRVASSSSFRSYFATKASPSEWAEVLSQWDEDTLDTAILIVKEEEAMLKEVALKKARKEKVNDVHLLQRIEQMRVKAHQS